MTKPFDPTKPVQTRDGRAARIVCTDYKAKRHGHDIGRPILALVASRMDGEHEHVYTYTVNGSHHGEHGGPMGVDLVNIPERGYVVIWETREGKLFVCTEVLRSIEARDRYIREIRARPNPLNVHSIHEVAL